MDSVPGDLAALCAELKEKDMELARLRKSKAARQERWEADHNALYRMRATLLERIMNYTRGCPQKPEGGS